MKKRRKTKADRAEARERAAAAIAEWLDSDDLDLADEALRTAIDDSCEWAKYSDEGDDRRERESEMLSRISGLFDIARDICARSASSTVSTKE